MARNMDFNYDVKELKHRINQYFSDCDAEDKYYTAPGLAMALDIPLNRLAILLKLANECTTTARRKGLEIGGEDEDIQLAHLLVVQKAITKMQDALEQRKDVTALFLMKQPVYGGYTDRPPADSNSATVTVKVKLEGVGKGVDPGA